MLLEHDRLHVRLVDHHVDDAELGVGEFAGDFLERGRPGEADGHDRREAVLGEFAQHLLALRVALDFEIAEIDARFLLEFRRAVEDAFVEGLVELAAEVVDDRRLDVRREGGGRSQERKTKRRAHARRKNRLISDSIMPIPRYLRLRPPRTAIRMPNDAARRNGLAKLS